MNSGKFTSKAGFTMIELLMVILIVAALSAVALPQFLDFRKDARLAVIQQTVSTMRSAITNMKSQLILNCGAPGTAWPTQDSINDNDVVASGQCTAAQIPNQPSRQLSDVSITSLPQMLGEGNLYPQIVPYSCDPTLRASNGNPAAFGTGSSIWCYNSSTGDFWGESTAYPQIANF